VLVTAATAAPLAALASFGVDGKREHHGRQGGQRKEFPHHVVTPCL
jgi:hypothetical protein